MFKELQQSYRRWAVERSLSRSNIVHCRYIVAGVVYMIYRNPSTTRPVVLNCSTFDRLALEHVILPPVHTISKHGALAPDYLTRRVGEMVASLHSEQFADEIVLTEFIELDNKTWYLGKSSIGVDNWLTCYSFDKDEYLTIPLGILPILVFTNKLVAWHPYVTQVMLLTVGGLVPHPRVKPMITGVPSTSEQAAIHALVAVDGCPGLTECHRYDLTIDVASVDQRLTTVVDLAELLAIVDANIDLPAGYKVDIGKIKIMLGLFPVPVAINDLGREIPENQVVYMGPTSQSELSRYALSQRHYNICVPTQFGSI